MTMLADFELVLFSANGEKSRKHGAFHSGSETYDVAIITRTKDRPLLLSRAAQSVAAQSFKNYIWVVVNDAGDRTSVETAIANSGVDPSRILLLHVEESRGMEAASNLGIANSRSNLIVIHDDDDSWEENFLFETVSFLQSRSGYGYDGVISKVVYVSEEIVGQSIIERDQAPYQDSVHSVGFSEMARGNFFPPIAFVFRRSVYNRIGGFNETLPVLGDWFFNLEFLLLADIGVTRNTTAYYHHRDSGKVSQAYANSVIGSRDAHARYAVIARNQFIRKHAKNNAAVVGVLLGNRPLNNTDSTDGGVQRNPIEWDKSANLDYGALELEYDRLWIIDEINRGYLFEEVKDLETYKARQVQRDVRLEELLAAILERKIPVEPPASFDEKRYLEEYPDVMEACADGHLPSGYIHYLMFGRNESRRRFRK